MVKSEWLGIFGCVTLVNSEDYFITDNYGDVPAIFPPITIHQALFTNFPLDCPEGKP
jgi:hypothetical protein